MKKIVFLLIISNTFLLSCEKTDEQIKNESLSRQKSSKVNPEQKQKGPSGLPVKASKVKLKKISDQLNVIGTLLANESVVIRPEINGIISKIHFKEGQVVKNGQKLISIENSEFRAQLDAVRYNLITEKNSFKRMEDLYKKNFISKDALELKRGNVNSLQAKFVEFQSRLAKTVIKAPFSGNVGLRLVSPGAYVNSGQDIVILENIDQIKVDFKVPEIFMSKIRLNQKINIKLDAYQDKNFNGSIYAIQPVIEKSTRTFLVRAKISNREKKLKPGMFARVNITLEERPSAIVIPEEALWPQGIDNFVYKIKDNKAILTKIVIGKREPNRIEIVDGLMEGDIVVTEGQIKLRSGVPVVILPNK